MVLLRVLLAACAGLAAVGFSRAAPSAWLSQGATGAVGALFCVLALQLKGLPKERLAQVGGAPLSLAGATAGVGVVAGAGELLLSRGLTSSTAMLAGPVAVLGGVLLAVSALRLSTALEAKRVLRAVALLSFLAAAATTMLLARTWALLPALPGVETRPARVG
ncbi:MAG: hypothetical protein IT380_29400 [Myxococcales bacterium]|nr:hypothetical protein [Myxococcales bacterium]